MGQRLYYVDRWEWNSDWLAAIGDAIQVVSIDVLRILEPNAQGIGDRLGLPSDQQAHLLNGQSEASLLQAMNFHDDAIGLYLTRIEKLRVAAIRSAQGVGGWIDGYQVVGTLQRLKSHLEVVIMNADIGHAQLRYGAEPVWTPRGPEHQNGDQNQSYNNHRQKQQRDHPDPKQSLVHRARANKMNLARIRRYGGNFLLDRSKLISAIEQFFRVA